MFEDAFDRVLKFVEKARREGLEVEITAVRIPEVDVGKGEGDGGEDGGWV